MKFKVEISLGKLCMGWSYPGTRPKLRVRLTRSVRRWRVAVRRWMVEPRWGVCVIVFPDSGPCGLVSGYGRTSFRFRANARRAARWLNANSRSIGMEYVVVRGKWVGPHAGFDGLVYD